eukprot:CAMPEP_0183502630 /NCGR_PEP_ID=MMETSP0371-20130417/4363_1 /TAXON_ID=268820 /ORGANISM="Peridinium aciculiferum, Strain PAER-2" /LENGTH=313 /DNA_ID=CAMNT_0025697391 /DNA_START=51 /DNA_END=989 /DNA_ORIENTATION=-
MVHGGQCWYCEGSNPEACPVCAACVPEQESCRASSGEGPAFRHGGSEGRSQQRADEAKRLPACQEDQLAVETLEEVNLCLLHASERHVRNGDAQSAHDVASACLSNLMAHFGAPQPGAPQPRAARPIIRAGERELLCLAFAQFARCCLLRQSYFDLADYCERSCKVFDAVRQMGGLATLLRQERTLLGDDGGDDGKGGGGSGAGVGLVGAPLAALGAAAAAAVRGRERVGHGFAPEAVLEQTRSGLEGVRPLSCRVFLGLDSLRAHLHVTRSQAFLEMERWAEAKEEATLALECDSSFKEAEYMLESAQNEEW